jgi:uncharacterized membrane protein (UPF0127 family)
MQVENQTRDRLLITHGEVAETFWTRFRGLMGRRLSLKDGEGLVLKGDKSIHTFFMRFAIDVVYADRAGRVVRVDPAMLPNRIGPIVFDAAYILEMPVGAIQASGTAVGDQLLIRTGDQRDFVAS